MQWLLIIIFIAAMNLLQGQPVLPPKSQVFVDTLVPRVDVLIDPDTLDWIYENPDSDIEFHSTFIFSNGTIEDTIENTGFRLRGNTSRYAAKKSFCVSFNTFEPGRNYYGLDQVNLNGEHNDPSVIRSKLSWEILRKFGIPAPRANHVQLYINGNYHGLYINVEHIDDEFVMSRFGNDVGNLFKCLWPADLAYLGEDPDLYKLESYGRRIYELKINEQADDYSDLATFIGLLNNVPASGLPCALDSVFNIADYFRIVAADIFIGNWDGYIYNKNNFYLYHNTATGKFEYIPYDLDNTFGIDWMDRDWGTRNIYDWEQHGSEVRPLYTRLMDHPLFKDRFSYYMRLLISDIVSGQQILTEIDRIRSMIYPYILDDPYYPLDYGYTADDFLNSYNSGLGGHVPYGIIPYIQTRISSALDQLELNDMVPVIRYISTNSPVAGSEFHLVATLDDEQAATATLVYSINDGNILNLQMFDDGNHQDGAAGDNVFGVNLGAFAANTTFGYQVLGRDLSDQTDQLPCTPEVLYFLNSTTPNLFINEIMADNESVLADEYGEFDDWVEIYNGGTQPVNMKSIYLTDDNGNFNDWRFPDTVIGPGEFMLIWADGSPEEGSNHASFKLSREGEEVALYDSLTMGFVLIDEISFGPQTTDISFGRVSDGGINWNYLQTPTPGSTNQPGAMEDYPVDAQFTPWPNPPEDGLIFLPGCFTGDVFDLTGRPVLHFGNSSQLDISSLRKGMYLLRTSAGLYAKFFIR